MRYLETATTMVNSQLLLSQLKAATHLDSFTEYITFFDVAQTIIHIPTELFMFKNHEQTYVACKYKHPLTRGARPTNPAMHACGLMDGALGATDTLHDKPFDIELSSAGPPLPEDDPAGKKSRKA
ncbi:hypothetical protein F2Q70_00012125 [Brassica cretica]|uniref:Uncharacterized protein n=1 Tax=Brassica cretica TaxID=69181 RepID=A0A3N6RMA0_BRACR|nr:hypothetical protein F2Q70_00012125 [Brassica cretica]KAF3543771.1 hypothetical protein DY000_02007933 [Brassica cretica]